VKVSKEGDALATDKEIGKLAEGVLKAYAQLESGLYGKGRFPISDFRLFFEATVRYIEATKEAAMIHRSIASIVSALRDELTLQAVQAPDEAISDAERLECMLFSEYDPYFKGHEPPGL
jgi:hypothetical protein